MRKIAVVLFNLGGPDGPEDVEPFLFNLFEDPYILAVPMPPFMRWALAKFISVRRAPSSRELYSHLGGGSPLLANTQAQANALEGALAETLPEDDEARVFIAMRYWHPMADDAARAVKEYDPNEIALLPLYPQFSTTTTQSSFDDWRDAARDAGLTAPTRAICCYPHDSGFITGAADLIADSIIEAARSGAPVRALFSAHGLPERIINSGDPYQWQVELTYQSLLDALDSRADLPDFEPILCYQSQVGPLKWIGPPTEDEIERAGADGCALVVAPIAFVSEHLETLVELDIEYGEIAEHSDVPAYVRVPTVSAGGSFIIGLANLVAGACGRGHEISSALGPRICPPGWKRCPMAVR